MCTHYACLRLESNMFFRKNNGSFSESNQTNNFTNIQGFNLLRSRLEPGPVNWEYATLASKLQTPERDTFVNIGNLLQSVT